MGINAFDKPDVKILIPSDPKYTHPSHSYFMSVRKEKNKVLLKFGADVSSCLPLILSLFLVMMIPPPFFL